MMPPPKEWREFIACLNSNRVEYMVAGAVALAHHGLPRYTGDLDVWIRSSPENARRTLAALKDFGFGDIGLEAADLSAAYQVIQLGFPPRRIDLLTSLSGVSFEDAWSERAQAECAGVRVAFIGAQALLRNKRATGRTQDLADAEGLARLLREALPK